MPFEYLYGCHIVQLAELAHLVDVGAEVGAGADQAVGIGRREAVLRDEPPYQALSLLPASRTQGRATGGAAVTLARLTRPALPRRCHPARDRKPRLRASAY